jgi:hypothetical protein
VPPAEDDDDWREVCTAPCDAQLPVEWTYRVSGNGIRPSNPFRLTGNPGDHVNVTVNASSTAWFVVGIVIVPIAGFFTLGGLLAVLITETVGNGRGSEVAWSVLVVSGVAMAGSIALIVNNARSSTSQDVAGRPAEGLLPGVGPGKLLTSRDASPEQKAAPPVFAVPLWAGRF